MAKKIKDEVPNPNSVTNRDVLQRMNFLYQASAFLNNLVEEPSQHTKKAPTAPTAISTLPALPPLPGISSISESRRRQSRRKKQQEERRKKRHPATCEDLSRTYIRAMKSIGQKTNVRLDPAVKRTLCKACNIVLMPGLTATVRVKASATHGNMMVFTCMSCKKSRRIPAPPTLQEETPIAGRDPPQASAAAAEDDDTMAIDPSTTTDPRMRKRRGKKKNIARLPPLFDRDAGHVLFQGNKEVEMKGRARFMCSS
ncbi:hypothetical protein EIP91_011235 [Steccherinum ochraceum]|uniref:Rpr2-domain-containing protein n=1 Tax=Steccherinum ochraceum TaxID=92696 RepID=A0A4R0RS24_9APHY|nr:hypothetical protein EIP91_011235 [Steccherinum ochraceum]